MTLNLIEAGLSTYDIFDIELEAEREIKEQGERNRYIKLINNPNPERQHLDLSKPFNFYSNTMRIGFTERLNLIEREIVQHLLKNAKQVVFDEVVDHSNQREKLIEMEIEKKLLNDIV